MGKLTDKVAVITGATAGMALATAKLFAAEGAYVYITGRRADKLEEAVNAIGQNVTGVRGDAANLADLDRLYDTVKREKGRIDVLFASAGYGDFASIADVTEEHYHRIFDLNVKGLLFTVQKAIPLLADHASIILNGSVAGSTGFANFGVYNASKAAVRSFARTWTSDLKHRHIRTNVISPGPIETDLFLTVPEEQRAGFISQVPLGRIGQPGEIATAALFLASSDSSFVTGNELFVDGGLAAV